MVYVQSKNGQPLMPTEDHRMVRLLLRDKKAKVVKRTPFTIRLLVPTHCYKQDITLGVDAGSKHVGVSATTEGKELYAAEITLRNDIVKLLSTRRSYRRDRRNRKKRYRPARFNNRVRTKHKGWLAPSVQQKINTHLKIIEDVHKILPISKIIIETASFDVQKLKNPDISGVEYQQGEQLGFSNVREYVLFRDKHKCRCCKGKTKDNILQVHHIESRKTGGNAPNNLVTLCKTCHEKYHKGKIKLPNTIKRGNSFRDAAFMGIMRWSVYNKLKELYPDVSMTYGYITKHTRIENGLVKTHAVDARCISGHPNAKPLDAIYMQEAKRRHNRQTHKAKFQKGGKRPAAQTPKYMFGYQLFDKVLYEGREVFVTSRRTKGSFTIQNLGKTFCKDRDYKKLKKLESRKTILTEREVRVIPPRLNTVAF